MFNSNLINYVIHIFTFALLSETTNIYNFLSRFHNGYKHKF